MPTTWVSTDSSSTDDKLWKPSSPNCLRPVSEPKRVRSSRFVSSPPIWPSWTAPGPSRALAEKTANHCRPFAVVVVRSCRKSAAAGASSPPAKWQSELLSEHQRARPARSLRETAVAARTSPRARDTIRSFHGERHGCIKGAHPRGVLRAKVIFAANVIPWNELRGVNRVIRSFRALTKFTPPLPHKEGGSPCPKKFIGFCQP